MKSLEDPRSTSLCFLSPREPVEPLDEELPVVEQLLDIWFLERYPAFPPYAIASSSEEAQGKNAARVNLVQS